MSQAESSATTQSGPGGKIALIVVSILGLAIAVAILVYLFMVNAEESSQPAPVGSETAMVENPGAVAVDGLAVGVPA